MPSSTIIEVCRTSTQPTMQRKTLHDLTKEEREKLTWETCLSHLHNDKTQLHLVPRKWRTESMILEWISGSYTYGFRLRDNYCNLISQLHHDEFTNEICYAASGSPSNIQYFPDSMKTVNMCLTAVDKQSYLLRFVPPSLQTDAVCKAAIQKEPHTIRYVHNQTPELCLFAAKLSNSGVLDLK